MKSLGFVYLSYKRRDLAFDVPDMNRDWKSQWFFIGLKDLNIDWAFPNIWHKTPLTNSWKKNYKWSLEDQNIFNLITNIPHLT